MEENRNFQTFEIIEKWKKIEIFKHLFGSKRKANNYPSCNI